MFDTKYQALAAKILADTDAYIVNPGEKMQRTLDKLVENKNKQVAQAERSIQGEMVEHNRGYGEGRKMGD